MKQTINILFHYIKRCVIILCKFVFFFVPKENKLILFTAWFGQKYADSSRYLYEYMLRTGYYKPCWYARNYKLYKKLKEEGKPVVYSKSFAGAWKQIRACVLVSSVQTDDFSPYFLIRCKYVDLDHGFIVKQVGFSRPNATKRWKTFQKLIRFGISFYTTSPSTFGMEKNCECYKVSRSHVIFCNRPRIDVLFDESLRLGNNAIVEQIKKYSALTFVYMPTHRSSGKIKMNLTEILDMDGIEMLCEKYNAILIVKKHFYHRNEKEVLTNYKRIIDITHDNIETQTLLYQADVLISDYSACYIDYLSLNRPIILYTYDLEKYLKTERNLYIKIEDNHVGYKPITKKDLLVAMEAICRDPKDEYHAAGRKKLRLTYYDEDVEFGNSCERITNIITDILNNKYKNKWEIISQR